MRELVIRPHSPWRARLLGALAVVAAVAALWGMFEFGRYRAGFDSSEAAAAVDSLQAQVDELARKKTALEEQIVLLRRSQDIDKTAHDEVQQDVESQQNRILKLQEELAFYKGIVSPEDGQSGLKIQSLKLIPGGAPRIYHYRLVLIQAIKHERHVDGRVDLKFYGAMDGKPTILDISDLAAGSKPQLVFSFQYFQNLEGDLVLPAGFKPGRVEVTLDPRGGGQNAAIRQNFDWTSVTG